MKVLLIVLLISSYSGYILAQGCCSGGGGNPLSGNAATGVLQKNQFDIMTTYKYGVSSKFLAGDSDTVAFFEKLTSHYNFLKLDYGISDRFTMSAGIGYYPSRTIFEFPDTLYEGTEMHIEQKKIKSSGIGDLILFPKYSVFNKSKGNSRAELTLGLGVKIPLGSANDSTFVGHSLFFNQQTMTIDSMEIWQVSPPTVQTTTGSNDLMLYGFFLKEYSCTNFKFFINALYMRNGWNELGLKFGDYTNVGLFAGYSFLNKKLGLLAQFSGERVGQMKVHRDIDPLAMYNIDTTSTGSYKVSFTPQISYTIAEGLSIFALAEIPLYQYMRGTQVAAPYQITGGISYRFFVKKPEVKKIKPMDTTGFTSVQVKVWGKCGMCKDKIEKTVMAMPGVGIANYDIASQMLSVSYNERLMDTDAIQKRMASIGYDTEKYKASNKAYNNLHTCCKYERE